MNIDVVLVTFNRLDKLKKAFQCFLKQTHPFRNLIIVNNNSTDGTDRYLQELKEKKELPFNLHIINLPENTGGSGGFNAGEEYAMKLNPDWIYVQDDDAYPEPQLIEKFESFITTHSTDKIAAICTSVISSDDMAPDIEHRADFGFKFGFIPTRKPHQLSDYAQSSFEINLLSYVGSFINAKAIEEVGPMRGDFFIYWDDGEHSLRLSNYGKIICVPSIHVIHESKSPGNDSDGVFSWRRYYNARNFLYTLLCINKAATIYMCCRYIGSSIKTHNFTYTELVFKAIRNALKGNLGKHPVYRPGYIVKK